MNNLISISTGLIYKFTTNRDKMVKILKEFAPDGIEFVLAEPEYIESFSIQQENLAYLDTLARVTIHAPWIGMNYAENNKAYTTLSGLDQLAKMINAKNVTFDCAEIEDFTVLGKYDFQASIENDDWRKPINTPRQISNILEQNPNLFFTFDLAHALTLDHKLIPQYLDLFKDQISQIHLSYFNRQMSSHGFFCELSKSEQQKIIPYLKLITDNIPIVIECVANNLNEINLVKKEIVFLRSI